MSVKEEKINKLIDLFNNEDSVSLERIEKELQIKKRAAKGYINSLREQGIEVKCKRGIYSVNNKDDVSNSTVLSIKDLREIKILHIVSRENGVLKASDIIKRFTISFEEEAIVSDKTIMRDIKSCIEKEYLYKEGEVFFISRNMRVIYDTDEEDIYRFIDLADIASENIPFYKEIGALRERLTLENDYNNEDLNIYSIGREYKDKFILSELLENFDKVNFHKKVLLVKYNSRIGILEEEVQVITFFYSWDKDKSYIIGKVRENIYLINIETILDIKELNKPNRCYKAKVYIDILKDMFGASLDGPYNVRVEFDNVFNIKSKVERLHNNRPKSKVYLDKDKNVLIYQDKIYGIYDFANYLRKFGSSCRVIEPTELRNIMINSYKAILNNYEVDIDEKYI